MANTNAPFGFVPTSNMSGAAPNYGQVTRLAQYNAAAIYTGDVVASQADGTIAIASPGTTQIFGIFVGCEYLSVSQGKLIWNNYWPGSDVASGNYVTCYCINDPAALFTAQAGGSTSTGIVLADIGNNVNFAVGTPTAANGRSGAYVDVTTLSPSTTTRPFRIISLITAPPGANGTDATSAYNQIVVGFNFADSRSTTGT